MIKLRTLIICTVAATIILSTTQASDCNNPLLTTYGFTSLGSPQAVSDLKYCKSLTQSCCSADTINGFKAKADDMIARLTDSVAKRDKFLVETRTKTIPKLQDKFQSLKDKAEKAVKNLQDKIKKNSGNAASVADTVTAIQGFGDMKDSLNSLVPKAKNDFAKFQRFRATCIVKLVKIQAAAWCLACDPDYATKGISAGSLELSNGLKTSLINSCLNYFTHSSKQNSLLSFSYLSDSLDALITGLSALADGTSTDATGFESAATASEDAGSAVTDVTQKPVYLPPDCTESSCDWLESALFVAGKIKEDLLAAGGSFTEAPTTRLLQKAKEEDVSLRGRMLAAGWSPSDGDSGVEVSMLVNPGGVDNSSAWRQGAFMSCLLGLLMVLFL